MASARLSAAGLGHSEYDLRPTAARAARCPDAYATDVTHSGCCNPPGWGCAVRLAFKDLRLADLDPKDFPRTSGWRAKLCVLNTRPACTRGAHDIYTL